MKENIVALENLTQDRVYVVKQQYIVLEGVKYEIGQRWRRAYENTKNGRDLVKKDLEEKYQKAIFSVWGNTPTVEEIPL